MGRNFVGYAEQENGVDVMLASGEDFRCPCLVGADGIYSRVREMKIGDALESLNVSVVLRMVPSTHPLLRDRVTQTLDGATRIYTTDGFVGS